MFAPTYFAPTYFAPTYFPNGTGVNPDPIPAECGNDVLAAGSAWLTRQLQAHVSQPIVYKRGTVAIPICATLGRTLFRLDSGDGGVVMEYSDADFLIPTASLVLSGSVAEPQRGDLIKQTKAGVLYTYEVLAPGGEPPWRWSDQYKNSRRIHTKLIAQA